MTGTQQAAAAGQPVSAAGQQATVSWFVFAQFANDFGTWFGRVAALTALAHHSVRLAALLVVADTLPRALSGPLLSRRKVANPVYTVTACCLAEAAVMSLAATVGGLPAALIALFAVRGALDAVLFVTFQAMVARLPLDRGQLLRANFRLSLASAAAILTAPVIAGILTATTSVAVMLLVDASSYIVMLTLLAVPLRQATGWDARPPAARRLRAPGSAGPVLWTSGIATLAGGCFNALLPALFLGVLAGRGRDLGTALTCFGVGTLVVNLAGSRAQRLRASRALASSLVLGGILLGGLALTSSAAVAFPIVGAFGAMAALRATSTRYLIQLAGGDEPVGILATWQAVNNLGLMLGAAIALALAAPSLVRPALAVLGALYAAAALALSSRLIPAVSLPSRRSDRMPSLSENSQ